MSHLQFVAWPNYGVPEEVSPIGKKIEFNHLLGFQIILYTEILFVSNDRHIYYSIVFFLQLIL